MSSSSSRSRSPTFLHKVVLPLLAMGLLGAGLWWVVGDRVRAELYERGWLHDARIFDPSRLGSSDGVLSEGDAPVFYAGLRNPGSSKRYDPVAGVVLKPGFEQDLDWPEHSTGMLRFRTNNLGFREDVPTDPARPGLRVLVVGDSHTEGAVHNRESFANVLETLISEALGAPVEVLNAGVGGTGPYAFLGSIHKHLALEPDLVIAALYTGNDFANALLLSDHLEGRQRKPRSEEYMDGLARAQEDEAWAAIMPQGFNQAYLFRYLGAHDSALALETAVGFYREMSRVCAEAGADFLTVVIPTKPDVDGVAGRAMSEALLAGLSLDADDFALNRRLGQRFVAALGSEGILCVDPTGVFERSDTELYWRRDHHLNVAGHALLAEQLLPPVRESLAGSLNRLGER